MHNGDFVWYELATDDPDVIASFYARVIGWSIEDARIPGMQYRTVKASNRRVAGIMGFLDDLPLEQRRSTWVGYIASDDVDAATARVASDGGRILRPPEDLPGVGRLSVVTDPQGATFMLFKSATDVAEPLPFNSPGTVGWHELQVKNAVEGLDFYTRSFGWAETGTMPLGDRGAYRMFAQRAGEGAVGGVIGGDGPNVPSWLFYFAVDDIDGALAQIEPAGGRIDFGPQAVPGDLFVVQARDPAGAVFGLVGPRP